MKYVFGNWKMYADVKESLSVAKYLSEHIDNFAGVEVALFPSALAFAEVRSMLSPTIKMGAQNVAWTPMGAYTGAISAHLFADAGAKYALVGHSERRHVFGESNDDVRKKVEACVDAGIVPVICIGETEGDKNSEKTEYRLKKQLMKAMEGVEWGDITPVVAYEPVWAIAGSGFGVPCAPEQAQKTHMFISEQISQYIAAEVPVLYGGSVNQDNVLDYVSLPGIDGVLVGSASVKPEQFETIVSAVESA